VFSGTLINYFELNRDSKLKIYVQWYNIVDNLKKNAQKSVTITVTGNNNYYNI
jgi:hypothetical protein